ncbi:MAG: polysulfide reductase NrfD [Chloroflexi bacterium]|nr:polysulfide reductase NrfD [Chloroflexota bacterium]
MQQTINLHDRDELIAPLYQFDRKFWTTLVVLIVIIAPGMLLYARQLVLGLGVTDLNRPVFWGAYLVNFIFLIGIAMAGTVISAVLQLLKVNWRRPITRIAESLTVFGLMTAGLQIIMDMGRPDRLVFTLLYGRLQAPLLWDIASLTLYLLTAIFALYLQLIPDIALLRDTSPASAPLWRKKLYSILSLGWTGAKEQWRRLEKAITVVSVFIIPIGISLHTVTSWLFSTTVQPGWKSTILGPYFVVGAIFSGIGLLFIATTFARQYNKHLKEYITESFYTNLGWIFIVMSAVWFYFTLNETLVVVTEQETLEFPVMASKLFGEFAPAFWGMIILMIAATWILVAPKFVSDKPTRNPLFQTATGLVATAISIVIFFLLWLRLPALAAPAIQSILIFAFIVLFIFALLGVTKWMKTRIITSTVIASAFVLFGMWLERWNILLPTLTHARLIPYTTYNPTITEIAVTISTFGILTLMFVVFYKFFPSISIWEVEEGRALEADSTH